MVEDLDEQRYILRKHRLGVHLTDENVSKYMMYHRFLTVEEMARRMHDSNIFFNIFDAGAELNEIAEWEKTLRGFVINQLKHTEEVQSGIFFIRRDSKFPGGLRVFADIGTILDSSLVIRTAKTG